MGSLSFSRPQLGIILILAAGLLGLYGWRAWYGSGWPRLSARMPDQVFVEVAGEVARPGVYAFPAPPDLAAIWRQAGGPEPPPLSDLKLASGTRVEVHREGHYTLGPMSGSQLLTLGLALDPNTASAKDLEALPGVGPVIARRLVEYRQSHGPFRKPEDLLQVSGIGPKKLEQLRPFLCIEEGETPPSPEK